MEKNINIQVVSIKEELFSVSYENMPSSLEEAHAKLTHLLNIRFGIDEEKELFKTNIWIKFQNKENVNPDSDSVVSFRMVYVLRIANIRSFLNTVDDTVEISLPDGVWRTILADVYATARAMLSVKLSGTPLHEFYLPFEGSKSLFENQLKRR